MAKQTINQGTAPTGAGGDTFRSGSAKLQANDDEIYSQLGATAQGVLPAALPLNKGGTGATTAAAARTALGLTLTTSNTDSTPGRVLKVGDFGLGGGSVNLSELGDIDSVGNCFLLYSYDTAAKTDADKIYNPIPNSAMMGFKVQHSRPYAFHLAKRTTDDLPVFMSTKNGVKSGWKKFYTEVNTTVDSNGFIKAASPIVELYADHIELNEEAKQQNITFEKLGIGDYLIKGSSGFAQEGWYVETPKDANGNVLFSVVYTTLKNGDISVKTYKKKFDIETASIVADLENPVDITENRWIDLRLQELPQPEIEMPGSIAPPDFQPTGLAQAVATVMESYHDTEQ